MKNLFVQKGHEIPYFLSLGATLCGAISFILYLVNGTSASIFVSAYCIPLIVVSIIAIVIGVFSLVFTTREALIIQYVLWLYCFIRFMTSIIELFGGMVYGEETAVMPISFVLIMVLTAISFIASLVSAILFKEKKPEEVSHE